MRPAVPLLSTAGGPHLAIDRRCSRTQVEMTVRKLLHAVRNRVLVKFGTPVLHKDSGWEQPALGDAETIERRVISAFFFLRYAAAPRRACAAANAALPSHAANILGRCGPSSQKSSRHGCDSKLRVARFEM